MDGAPLYSAETAVALGTAVLVVGTALFGLLMVVTRRLSR